MCRTGSGSRLESGAVYAAMKMTGENSSGESDITMDDVKNLIKKKDEIEEQIKAYYDVLEDVSVSDIHTYMHTCSTKLTYGHWNQ